MKYKKLIIGGIALFLVIVLAVTLAIVIPLSTKSKKRGGGINETGELEGSLVIRYWMGGYGKQHIQNVIDAFEAANPKVDVELKETTLKMQVVGDIVLEKKYQKYDLFMADLGTTIYKDMFTKDYIKGYDRPFLDLTEVFNYKWEGEDKTIAEKLNPQMREYCTQVDNGETKHYMINYGTGSYGITYNADLLQSYLDEELGGELPRTTDELIQICNAINERSDIYPFIFTNTDYWNQIFYTWWAQYEGVDAFHQYFTGKITDLDLKQEIYSPQIFAQVGRLRAYEECNRFINYESGYIDPNSTGYQYMTGQKHYMDGEAMMMVNGGWLENEMSAMYNGEFPYEMSMMRVPVLSSIKEKCSTIGDDAELSALIKAIDEGTSVDQNGQPILAGEGYDVSKADFDKVTEARTFMYVAGEGQFAFIPVTTYSEVLAKEFLKFMFSDEGIIAYTNACSGSFLPVTNFDYTNAIDFRMNATEMLKANLEYMNALNWLFIKRNDPIVYNGNLGGQTANTTIEKSFGSSNLNDRVSPQKIYEDTINFYQVNDGAAWKSMLRAAGII